MGNKRIWMLLMVFMATVLVDFVNAQNSGQRIRFESLLKEMIDRDVIARFPEPAYRCLQVSSYDPKTKSVDEPGWFANEDWSFFRGVDEKDGRKEWIMLDVDGPGSVVRMWCTGPMITGHIRIYIDGAPNPVIEGKAVDIIGGKALVGDPLSAVRARGLNLYLPIPYSKHCKITYDGPNFWETKNNQDPFYYHVNYRTYAAGTSVESFDSDTLKKNTALIEQVSMLLLTPAKAGDPSMTGTTNLQISGTGGKSSHSLAGPGALRRLTLKFKAANAEQALRSTVLSMEFDGEKTVWCPLGDFFGSGVGLNPFQSWWQTVEKDGTLRCFWPMPFEKSCSIHVENLGKEPIDATVTVEQGAWKWDDRSMHFRANWKFRYPFESQPAFDWNYLKATGRGVLVGDVLTLLNTNADWWGEGDEKIYVDGEAFPSHLGTGTEDYYGYAYCTPEFFQDPFHAQPRADGPRNFGRVTNMRVRSLDAIPFEKSLQFDIEVWHWTKATMEYATTVFWYARPGAVCDAIPLPEIAAREVVPVPAPYRKVVGAIEAENLVIRETTGGKTEIQYAPEHGWSWGKQLWWMDGRIGDRLTIEVPVEDKGKYNLKANLTMAGDYGQVQISLDGQKIGTPLDLYHDGVTTSEVSLGTFPLDKGIHLLAVHITGANEKAVKRHMFGLDYLKLEKME